MILVKCGLKTTILFSYGFAGLQWTQDVMQTLQLTLAIVTCADTGALLYVMEWNFVGGVTVVVVS